MGVDTKQLYVFGDGSEGTIGMTWTYACVMFCVCYTLFCKQKYKHILNVYIIMKNAKIIQTIFLLGIDQIYNILIYLVRGLVIL